MITMIHSNPALLDGDKLVIDRKFHSGMENYVEALGQPILSVHPEARPETRIMDAVAVPLSSLPYRVLLLKTGRSIVEVLPIEIPKIKDELSKSRILYGSSAETARLARSLGLPYIMVLEYDFETQVIVTTSEVANPLRKLVRATRVALSYARNIRDMRGAYSLHCNGYPIFDETRRFNSNRLLYLDSRMTEDQTIPEDTLRARLAARRHRPVRLLFSGRYDPVKGAVDAVRVALACGELGLPVEMHCYGQGSQRAEMVDLAAQAKAPVSIEIHDPIPFPELVRISQTFDLFVCCHVQSDPSCTYLEAFGAGLPIVGYANRMWRRLSEVSGVGKHSKIGNPRAVAENIRALLAQPELLDDMSERARQFAIAHCFEREFQLRTAAIRECLERNAASR